MCGSVSRHCMANYTEVERFIACLCAVESGMRSQLAGVDDTVRVHGWTHCGHSDLRFLTRQVWRLIRCLAMRILSVRLSVRQTREL